MIVHNFNGVKDGVWTILPPHHNEMVMVSYYSRLKSFVQHVRIVTVPTVSVTVVGGDLVNALASS